MKHQPASKAPVMFKVQVVYADRVGRCLTRERARIVQAEDAVTRARHELDLGDFLANAVGPAGSAPITAQIVRRGKVLWELTAAERERERREPQLLLGLPLSLKTSPASAKRPRPRLRRRPRSSPH